MDRADRSPVEGPAPSGDTPRAAFKLVSRRVTIVAVAALLALSVAAWWRTLEQAHSMRGMVMGLGQIGVRDPGSMSAALVLAMWVTMMAAMMLPLVAPVVLAHLAVSRRRGDGIAPTFVFVAGYLLVWSAIGVVPLFAYWEFAQWSAEAASSRGLSILAGTILFVAGAWQFTGFKRVCLEHCHSPFGFIVAHDFGGGLAGALRTGIAHGMYCLGCCWASMTVLIVVGLMNVLWMAILFVLLFAEKYWKYGLATAKVAGVVMMLLGSGVIAWPALLPLISTDVDLDR